MNRRITFSDDEEDKGGNDSVEGGNEHHRLKNEIVSAQLSEKMDDATKEKPTRGFLSSDSEEESDEDEEGVDSKNASRFRIRPEYEGESGKALFEKQMAIDKYTGSDERFRMDASFLEDKGEDDLETKRNETRDDGGSKNTTQELCEERDRMMRLLHGAFKVCRTESASAASAVVDPRSKGGLLPSNMLIQKCSYFSDFSWENQIIRRFDPSDPLYTQGRRKAPKMEDTSSIGDKRSSGGKDIITAKKSAGVRTQSSDTKAPRSKERFVRTGSSWKNMFVSSQAKGERRREEKREDASTGRGDFKFSFPVESEGRGERTGVKSSSSGGGFTFGFTPGLDDVTIHDDASATDASSSLPIRREGSTATTSNHSKRSSTKSTVKSATEFSFWRGAKDSFATKPSNGKTTEGVRTNWAASATSSSERDDADEEASARERRARLTRDFKRKHRSAKRYREGKRTRSAPEA
eukprot:g1825.t1